ncbi:hypothetical protein [Plantactinospora soyae]|uniref:Uncharacterized protein n=1 Tax=Plantactinospora soyae TaxID=1544732 RepID=A0A927LZW0_9ACTN|nr:hypothetical protein [Plantactinospora soyae]MBE1485598.1 hypothetical protein [Plantactinospora soyae]
MAKTREFCDPIKHLTAQSFATVADLLYRRRTEHHDMTLDDALSWLESEIELLNEEHRLNSDCPGVTKSLRWSPGQSHRPA